MCILNKSLRVNKYRFTFIIKINISARAYGLTRSYVHEQEIIKEFGWG